ncbi:hypothetical protein ACWDOP_03255 [Nocardia sp. NPDC003693]
MRSTATKLVAASALALAIVGTPAIAHADTAPAVVQGVAGYSGSSGSADGSSDVLDLFNRRAGEDNWVINLIVFLFPDAFRPGPCGAAPSCQG